MKKKVNARLLTLILLIATVLCAVIACFVSFSLQNNNTADKDDTAITDISVPDRGVATTSNNVIETPLFSENYDTEISITYPESYTDMTYFDSDYMEVVADDGVIISAMLAGKFALEVAHVKGGTAFSAEFIAIDGYVFDNGEKRVTLTLYIDNIKLALPSFSNGKTIKDAEYTGVSVSEALTNCNSDALANMTYKVSEGVRLTALTANGAFYVEREYAKVGTSHTITFSCKDNYEFINGQKASTITLTIISRSISSLTISSISNQVYNGSAFTPTPTITYGDITLVKDTDYTIAYQDNTNVGTATVTITGKGNYTGTKSTTFTISARNISNATFGTIAAQTYNYGTAITPTPMITDSGISKTLTNNTDFTFSYSNNINAGSATITITGKGNYTGTKSTTFTINGRNLSGATIGTITNQSYDGTEKKPTATVTMGSVTLSSSTDFTFSWSNNINAGTATLTITGKGNYAGTKSASFTISARNISNATVAAIAAQSYTGAAKTPVPTVTDLSKTLTRDTDYTLSYSNNVAVGTAKITITGKGNYTGTKEVSFSITARNISSATVAAIGAYYYDGAAKEPTPAVTDGGSALVEGVDFTYSYRDNIDVGTATLILTGMGNYTGTKEVSFSIQPPTISIANVTISQDTYTYDGTAKEPRVTLVQIGSLTLREGVDFTVSYSSNTNAGTAKVVITGIGDYTGTKEVNFTINPADISYATVSGLQIEYTYTGTAVEPPITITLDGKTLTKNTDYLIVYSNNLNVGKATISITGSRNYTGTLTDGFTIIRADLSTATVTGIDATHEYTGSAITYELSLNWNGILLDEGTDYTVTYADNTELGTATVTITGLGNFTGTVTKTFVIVAADISSATVTGINASYGYTGSAIEPPLTVELNGRTLNSGTDYTVIYTDNVNKGTATVTITGIGNYTGTVVTTFVIGEGDINDATVSGIDATYGYTGSAIVPEPMVIYNSILLDEGTDYTVTYSPNVDLGIVTVTITGLGNFTGTVTKTFEIVAADISKATITDVDAEYPYTGSAITPEPTVTLNGVALVKDRDYTVTYRNNTNIGAGIVVVTGIGNYAGIKETAFTIGVADITNATVTNVDAEYPWTGTVIEPPLTVTLKGVGLVKDRDYTVTYTDNTEVGVASYEITGIGNYTGNITGSFEITKAEPTINISYADWDGTDKLFTGNALPTIEATATYNGVTVTGTIAWDT
ncbi:MAG: hypothetical protein K2O89_05680, partial [Clostridia bacterium]|nr:hypothetical protein [Clostridia bacterium]